MAGAYYTAVLPSCTVKTSPVPVAGSSMWCPDAPTGYTNYHVEDWNRLFPNYAVPVPTFCRRQQVPPPPSPAPPATSPTPPGATTPPTITPKPPQEGEPPVKPITGDPPSPPQEGCEPAMSVPEGGHATSSKFVNSGGTDLTAFGYSVLDQMGQPLAMGMTPLATYADNIPAFTHSPEMEIVSHPSGHQVNSLHEGTGPGLLVLHPPELQDYMLHGSGTNEDSRWPTEMSTSTLLLLNSERADASTGDEARTLFAFGEALKGTVKPGNGIYFDFDPATGVLNIQHTDASGGDATVANGVTIDGSPIGGGGGSDAFAWFMAGAVGGTGADTKQPLTDHGLLGGLTDDDHTQYILASGTRAFTGPQAVYETPSETPGLVATANATTGISINGTTGEVTLIVGGSARLKVSATKCTIPGLLDPDGLELTPVAANPGGTAANTLWLDSGDSNALKWGANKLATQSFVSSGYQPLDGELTALAGLTSAADKLPYFTGSGTASLADLTSFARTLIDDANAQTALGTLFAGASSLTSQTNPETDDILVINDSGNAEQLSLANLFKVVNNFTAESSPAYNDVLSLYDASASSADKVTVADLLGSSRCKTVEYTGSGSSGKTVTLTGINRAHYLVVCNLRNTGRTAVAYFPAGATGTPLGRRWDGNPEQTWMSLDAPAAGTAQVLTINTTDVTVNENTYTHRILVIGTPT